MCRRYSELLLVCGYLKTAKLLWLCSSSFLGLEIVVCVKEHFWQAAMMEVTQGALF